MASVQKAFVIHAPLEAVWAALADFGNLHVRLAAGFVIDCVLEQDGNGTVRHITFANGHSARERLVTRDDALRRLVYTVEGGRARHHNAAAQVFDGGDGTTRFVWTTDVLPDTLAPAIEPMMEAGAEAMRVTLEAQNRFS